MIDKPRGPTSRRVLDQVEKTLRMGALGHAGTLDPLASGILVAMMGRARRLQNLFMGEPKVYRAVIKLGLVSETLDGEGPVQESGAPVPKNLTDQAIIDLLGGFEGEQDQIPPAHSAVRIDGRRAYKIARKGRDVEMPSRRIVIHDIRLLRFDSEAQELHITVTCGSGTYIRSLARDIGERMGCGAYLKDLRRTHSGGFDVDQSVDPATVSPESLRPLSAVLKRYPGLPLTLKEAVDLAHGRIIKSLSDDWPEETSESLSPGLCFAWLNDEPFCRIKQSSLGGYRCDLLLVDQKAFLRLNDPA